MENLKKQLRGVLFNIYLEASKIGYRPTLLLQIISRNEDITSIVKRLISKETDGYVKLYELGRLDLSVDNYVLNPKYEGLFSDEDRAICRQRLIDYRYFQ